MKQRIAILAIATGILAAPTLATAQVTGVCSNCHTMHNSQNGATQGSSTAQNFLLKGGCLQCHSAASSATDSTTGAPVVYRTTSEPTTTTGDTVYKAPVSGSATTYLAGGDFYWVENSGDAYGHNVYEVSSTNTDNNLSSPPGFSSNAAFAAADSSQVGSTWSSNQLTCAGTYGCHGTHTSAGINGGHHGDDATIDGSTVAKSYRFLIGIKGIEDADWEQTHSSTDHNGYFGEARSGSDAVSSKNTISFLCAQCHGNFHSSDGGGDAGIDGSSWGSAWIRHPVDVDLQAIGSEYTSYTTYDPLVPVAQSTGTLTTTNVQTAGQGLVTCLSCHRAHGSPWPDILRWDYSLMSAGTTNTSIAGKGCFKCHSTKDGV